MSDLCENREQILAAFNLMLPMNRSYLLYSVEGRTILEEVVAELWQDRIKPLLQKLLRIMPILYRTTLLHVPRMRNLFHFLEENLGPSELRVGPCRFINVMQQMMQIPGIDRDLRFLHWAFSSSDRCLEVLSLSV